MAVELSKQTKARIDLHKEAASQVILDKGLGDQKSEVVLMLDISGSMYQMLHSGLVQRVCERLLALALNFDDDGEAPLYLFHDKAFEHDNPISLDNIENFVEREILANYSLGGTRYALVMNMLRRTMDADWGWMKSKRQGAFLGLFGGERVFEGEPPKIRPVETPTYVLFVTDGANTDELKAEIEIRESAYEPMFWQFVGIGGASFPFLEKLDDLKGRFLDNADFFQVNNIDRISDQDLYSQMLQEYPAWIKEARAKGILT